LAFFRKARAGNPARVVLLPLVGFTSPGSQGVLVAGAACFFDLPRAQGAHVVEVDPLARGGFPFPIIFVGAFHRWF